MADIQVTASGACVLNAWIDFNSDGDFADTGEQIAADLALVAGVNLLNDVPVPAGATGIMAARFRVTNLVGQGGGAVTGPATTGEVEDYVLAALGDLVWNDSIVGQGIQVGGDTPVQGVPVSLLAVDGVTADVRCHGHADHRHNRQNGNGNYGFAAGRELRPAESGRLPGDLRSASGLRRLLAAYEGGDDALDSDADQDTTAPSVEGLAPLPALVPIALTPGRPTPRWMRACAP